MKQQQCERHAKCAHEFCADTLSVDGKLVASPTDWLYCNSSRVPSGRLGSRCRRGSMNRPGAIQRRPACSLELSDFRKNATHALSRVNRPTASTNWFACALIAAAAEAACSDIAAFC